MIKQRILVVDDDKEVVRLMRAYLEKAGYDVLVAYNGETAVYTLRRDIPDLLLLDLMLPDKDGYDITRLVRADAALAHIPIIMLSARVEDTDKIVGLELGADDYVTKPFSPRILMARVKAALRRSQAERSSVSKEQIRIHSIEIDVPRYKVLVEGKEISLTSTEFKVLCLMTTQPGRVFTRYQIVDEVHGEDYPVTDRSVDVQIVGLRKKLGSAGIYIETVRGIGYRFKEEE